MDLDKEYNQIKNFTKVIFGISATAITIIVGVATYVTFKDMKSMREDYSSKLDKMDEQMSDLRKYSEDAINRIENRTSTELSTLSTTAAGIAREEAVYKVNESFKYGNVNSIIESQTKLVAEEKLDNLIEQKFTDFDTKLNTKLDLLPIYNSLADRMRQGDKNALFELDSIVSSQPFSTLSKQLIKLREIKTEDYNSFLEYTISDYKDSDLYSSFFPYFDDKIINDKTQLAYYVVNFIHYSDNLPYIAQGFFILRKLGFEISTFDFEKLDLVYNDIKEKLPVLPKELKTEFFKYKDEIKFALTLYIKP